MSRSNYCDDIDNWALIRWRGAVKSAINGKRGQGFLKELLAALEALEEKALVADVLHSGEGCCAIGAVGLRRGMDLKNIDPDDYEQVADAFEISEALVREIVFQNDEDGRFEESPECRYVRVKAWVAKNIVEKSKQEGNDEAA